VIKKQWDLLRTVLYEGWCVGGGGGGVGAAVAHFIRLSGSSRRRVKVGFAASGISALFCLFTI
jgi:hypothetical protein